MLLWIILTLMTAAAAVWLSAPLLRRRDARGAEASELEVYRDQLAEVEREQADGGIDAEQAEAAGLEIKRRLLGAARGQVSGAAALSLGERHFAVTTVVGSVVLGSVILYSNSGRPDLPSVAREATTLVLGDRLQGATFKSKSGAAASRPAAPAGAGGTASGAAPTSPAVAGPIGGAGSNGTAGNIGNAGAAAASLGSVDDMIQRLVDRLKKDPGQRRNLAHARLVAVLDRALRRGSRGLQEGDRTAARQRRPADLLRRGAGARRRRRGQARRQRGL